MAGGLMNLVSEARLAYLELRKIKGMENGDCWEPEGYEE